MRRVRDLRIQVAPLIVSPILSRSKISRRGLARALLPSMVPELLIRSEIFAPGGWLSQECRGRDRQPRQHQHFVSQHIYILSAITPDVVFKCLNSNFKSFPYLSSIYLKLKEQ